MQSPHISDDRLIDLVSGLLPFDQKELVQNHLRQCNDCERRFNQYVKDREFIRASAPPAFDDGSFVSGTKVRRRPSRPSRWAIAAVAVAALLAAFIWWPRSSSEYWLSAHFVESVSRGAPDGGGALEDARAAYQARDAESTLAAIRSIDLADASTTVVATAHVYKASALLNLGRPEEAIAALEALELPSWFENKQSDLTALPEPWRSEAMWVIFLAADDVGDNSRACSALQLLKLGTGDHAAKAREELARRVCN